MSEDTISFCTIWPLAGHVTTTKLLSQAIRCFAEHPEALELVRKQPELMPEAIEEVPRYASPVWRLSRITRETVEIAGVTIPKDEMIFAGWPSRTGPRAIFRTRALYSHANPQSACRIWTWRPSLHRCARPSHAWKRRSPSP
jgi:cytochrome P450